MAHVKCGKAKKNFGFSRNIPYIVRNYQKQEALHYQGKCIAYVYQYFESKTIVFIPF